ncbi:MAG: RAD55 family ATPase [Thermoplasmata archaeon]
MGRDRMVATKRIKTYIRGLDEHLQGGIPQGHTVLIAGKPGTMKSSVAYNILYHNAKIEKRSGVYVTLEQSRESVLDSMAGMGMALDGLEDQLSVLDLAMIRKKLKQLSKQSWIEVFKMYVNNLKSSMNVGLLVVDSLPVLQVMAKFEDPRDDLFRFFEWLRDLGITSFLIAEMDQDKDKFCEHGEDFLSDGIMHLDLRRDDRVVNLFLSIVKMRKTAHKRGYFPLIFDDGGFEVVTH